MKVAFVGAVPPLQGGVAQHGGYLVEALRSRGHDVTVESWSRQYPAWAYPGTSQIDPAASPIPGARYRLTWWNPGSWWAAGRRVRKHDVLMFPWLTQLQAPALRTIRAAAGIPSIAIVHNPVPHDRHLLLRPLTRLGLSGITGAFLHSPEGIHELERMAGLHVHKSAVLPMPAHLPVRAHPLPTSPPLRLLMFGFVRPYKGADTAIAALARARSDGIDARLTIAGELWGDEEALQSMIRDAGVEEYVDLELGYVPDDQVDPLFARHHIVIAPYHSATQSGVVPLAMEAERPVVASRVGALGDQLRDGAGLLVPAGDVGAFADAIRTLSSDLARFAAATRLDRTTWADVAVAIEELMA